MADDSIPLQHELGLNEFLEHYGTEEQCFDALYQWRWPDGFRCPHCGHDQYCQLAFRKLLQCDHCRRQTSVTAASEFDATKLPLGADPILTMEISNLPEIVRVYTTLCR